jgi:hypothetical protein
MKILKCVGVYLLMIILIVLYPILVFKYSINLELIKRR